MMRQRSGATRSPPRLPPRLLPLIPALLTLLLLSAPPTGLAQSAQSGPDLYLPDALVVGPDETLRLTAGTRVHGPGHVEVQGLLVAEGTAEAPVRLEVPVAVGRGGALLLTDVEVVKIPGAAVTLRGGTLTMERVAFADNRVGLVVAGHDRGPVVRGENLTFERHADAAVRMSGDANVTLSGAAFLDNALGIHAALDSPANASILLVSQSRFERNDEHVVLDFGAADREGHVRLEGNAFTGGLRALVLRGTATEAQVSDADLRTVTLERNLLRGATLGLVARGAGYVVDSRNDTFLENHVGLSAADSRILLSGTRFLSIERDLDLGPAAEVTFHNVTFTPAAAAVAVTPSPLPVLVGALLAGGAGLAAIRARRTLRLARAAAAAAAGQGAEAPPTDEDLPREAAPAQPMRVPVADARPPMPPPPEVSELEARILHDVAAFPGSPQIAIAQRLGLTRQALHYHVKKLVAAGLVEKTTVGRTTECRLAPHVRLPPPPPPLPLAVTRSEGMEKG